MSAKRGMTYAAPRAYMELVEPRYAPIAGARVERARSLAILVGTLGRRAA